MKAKLSLAAILSTTAIASSVMLTSVSPTQACPLNRYRNYTEQASESSDAEALWREAASAQFLRAQRPPPKFVPAAIAYEVGSDQPGSSSRPNVSEETPLGTSLSSWYRSLTTSNTESSAASVPQLRPSSAPIPTNITDTRTALT